MPKSKVERVKIENYERFDKKPYINLIFTVAAILMACFAIIMINQAAQLISLAMAFSPILGKVLLVIFLGLALAMIISMAVILARLEEPLVIPDQSDTEAYSIYLSKLKQRLTRNQYLQSSNFKWDPTKSDLDSINEALEVLDKRSTRIIKNNGSAVFVTTAVSQNGSLDSIFVLVTVVKLVWNISMLYNQRPAVRDLTKLYTNVFATALLARQIDDIDIMADQLGPILSSLVGGTVGTIVPGISYVGSFVVDCLLEGSLNTLLTLRVGIITKDYCRSITLVEPKSLGRTATIKACAMLGSIVNENSKRISDAMFRTIRNAAISPFVTGKDKFVGIYDKLFNKATAEADPVPDSKA